jgi:hypothetical protein
MKTSGPWYKRNMRKLRIEQTLKVCNGATTFYSLSTAQNIRSWRLRMYTELNTGAILREASYTEGYKAGKKAAAEELINEIYLGVRRECVDEDGAFMPGPFMNLMLDLKQKYGVK